MTSASAPPTNPRRLAALYGVGVAMVAVVGCAVPWLGALLYRFVPQGGVGLFVLWSFVLAAQLVSRRTPNETDNVVLIVAHLIGAATIAIVPAVIIVLSIAR